MQNYALWWPVVGGVTFLAVLILAVVLAGGQSPSSKTKQKRKKTKKRSRSRSPQDTTGHTVKKRTNVLKKCGRCKIVELMSDAAKCFKSFNTQASAPLDVSSSLSAQEESASSSAEGEGGEANSSSAIEESSSQRKSVQTVADVHNVSLSQISSQVQQRNRQ